MTLLMSSTVSTAVASEHGGESARGTIKIERTELGDADNPNEVKVGCDFAVEFYGFERGEVPVTFSLQPPSGTRVIARRVAQVDDARGNELSGTLEVDLTDALAGVAPAQAADYDYKVRVDAEVKSSEGNDSITRPRCSSSSVKRRHPWHPCPRVGCRPASEGRRVNRAAT